MKFNGEASAKAYYLGGNGREGFYCTIIFSAANGYDYCYGQFIEPNTARFGFIYLSIAKWVTPKMCQI
jgi:hypothetical protein